MYDEIKTKNILVEDNDHTFINSNLFLKGQYHSLNKERRDYVKSAQGDETYDSVYNLKSVSSKNEKIEKEEINKELEIANDDDIDFRKVSDVLFK